jgi:hypothetical protein
MDLNTVETIEKGEVYILYTTSYLVEEEMKYVISRENKVKVIDIKEAEGGLH